MNGLPPPRLSGLAWRSLSKGLYADAPSPLDRIEVDLAADYDLTDDTVRGVVWTAVVGAGVPPSLHEIVLRYEAEVARRESFLRRGARSGVNRCRDLGGAGSR